MSTNNNNGIFDNIGDTRLVTIILVVSYRIIFPRLLRKKVRNKFNAQTWIEFCDRLGGVGLIMGAFGLIAIPVLEANLWSEIESVNLINIMSSFYGILILALVGGFLHLVGLVTKGGVPIPINPTSSWGDLSYNFGRVIVGIGLIVGTYYALTNSSSIDQPLIEEIVEFIAVVGVLCLFLAPIFYGLGLIFRGVFEIVNEFIWRGWINSVINTLYGRR